MPVMISIITNDRWSIRKANGIFKSPALTQLKSVKVAESCPDEFRIKNKNTEVMKDRATIVLAIIPAWLCFNLFFAKLVIRKPTNGNAGTSQAIVI